MGKKKLLVLSSTYPRWLGDPEPGFVHQLSRRLIPEFDVHVICPHSKNALSYELLDGVHIYRFRYAPEVLETLVHGGGILSNIKSNRWKYFLLIPFFIGLAWTILKLHRKIRPDILHAHWIIPQGFILAVISTFTKLPPVLLTSHGGDLFGVDSYIMRVIKCFILKRFKKITVVSSAMIKKVEELGGQKENLYVLPMGVDLSGLFVPDKNIERVPNRILFVGRIVEKKGLIYLIGALAKLKKKYPSVHLIIAGDGSDYEKDKIKEKIEKFNLVDSILFLGAVPQSDLPRLYREASVFVAPFVVASSGDQEGLGLVALEAIGCLCPVVLGRVAAVEAFYQDVGLSPAIVNSRDENEIANAIEKVFQDPDFNQKLTLTLSEKIFKKLNWNFVSKEYSNVLNKCIDS